MKTTAKQLSASRLNRLREQGYSLQSFQELNELAFGNRFAYQLCTSFLLLGVALANIPVLLFIMIIALVSVLLPHHAFDYIYNIILAKKMGKPQLPPRSAQLKFACTIAFIWIGATIYSFYNQMMMTGYLLGSALIAIATLVSTIDLCIPSMIYNELFIKKVKASNI